MNRARMNKIAAVMLAALMLSLCACGGRNGRNDGYYNGFDNGNGDRDDDRGSEEIDALVGGADTSGDAVPSSLSGSPVLVSDRVTANPYAYNVTADSVYIQDIYDFMGSAMTVELPEEGSKPQSTVIYRLMGSDANADDIEQYVNTICNGSYNLELIDKSVESYDSTFVSYAISYTGAGPVDDTLEATFTDIPCSVNLYYTLERGTLEGQFRLTGSMEVVDLGLRLGGVNENVQVGGPSAGAGLYRMPDGSFETDDGRLTVEVGKATVLRDGELCTTDAEFDRGSTEDHMWARNFYRDETIFFSSPVSRLMTGDLFTLRDLYYNHPWGFDNAEDFDSYYHNEPFLGLGHDGYFIAPNSYSDNQFDDLTVRIMYWEPDVVGVYYVYARMSSAPYEIEALIAPSLSRTEGFTGASDERQMTQGQTISLDCSRKFLPNYELFTWELVSGQGVVELSGTTSATCSVKALRTGTAVVRVSYNYGVDEPDVLTGYDRNADHTDVQEFVIYVQ